MKWPELVWGRPTGAIASVGVALAAFWDGSVWLVLCALFIVVHAIVAWVRERRIVSRLSAHYRDVLRRILHLVADLADLSAGGYNLWMIEVYLPKYEWGVSSGGWPHRGCRFLVRELSVTVGGASEPPRRIALTHQLFGRCYRLARSELWWDRTLIDIPIDGVDGSAGLNDKVHAELKQAFGVISVHPLVDVVGDDCKGLLVIHVGRDGEAATKVLGALTQGEGKRRILGACNDIHSHIRRRI